MTIHSRRRFFALANCSLAPVLVALLAVPGSAAPGRPAASVAQPTVQGLRAWSIASRDIEADPAIRFGVLPNGMRYALMHNETPKGGGAIRFAFNVAHLEEADREQGVAHFLEHMAFNGSKEIPEGKLVPMLERLGLAFGADTNASTAFDRTTYKLDLPKVDVATVDAGLLMMHEIARNLTIAQAAVERERGIIQSESRVRNTVQRRQAASLFSTMVPGNRLGARIGITPEQVARTTAADIRNFYDGYYRPERATLVMVGDFDVAAMEQKVRARFADWRGRGPARASYVRPNPEVAPAGSGLFTDPAVIEAVSMQHVAPYTPPLNSVADERESLLRLIAGAALSNRLSVLSRDPASPIRGGRVGEARLFRSADLYGIDLSPKDGKWKEAMALAEQEMRRASQYGFKQSEIDESKANLATALANAAKQVAGRSSAALAEGLIGDSIDNSIPTSPAQQLALYQTLAPSITRQSVSDAFKAAWKGGPTGIHVSTQSAVPEGKLAIAEVLRNSAKLAIGDSADQVTRAFAYDSFGPAGAVVADRRIDEGIRTVRFANGVQLNIKKTDFEPGQVLFRMNVGSGSQSFPTDRQGLSVMVPVLSPADGLKAHDSDELRRIMAGHTVSLGLVAGDDGLIAQGGTTMTDFELQMKLLAAKTIASGYRPESQVRWASITPTVAKSIRSDAMQRFATAAPAIIADGDARAGLLDPEALGKLTLDDMKAAIEPQLQHGPIAIGVVGDVDEQAIIAAVAKTLGALPKRDPALSVPSAPLHFASDRSMKTIRHGGAADQGVVALAWPTTDDSDFKSERRRDLLAEILQLRLTAEVREKLAATYTPNAGSSASNTFKGFGSIVVVVPAQPSTMDLVVKSIRSIAADLVAHPATADELLRARKPILEANQRDERKNADWLGPVAKAQSDPDQLVRHRTDNAILSAITTADIQAEAKRWLTSEPLQIRALPEAAK